MHLILQNAELSKKVQALLLQKDLLAQQNDALKAQKQVQYGLSWDKLQLDHSDALVSCEHNSIKCSPLTNACNAKQMQ